MTHDNSEDVTAILEQARAGNSQAAARAIALIYEELRQVAGRLMRGERPDHTLQATALVNEAVVRLLGSETPTHASNRIALCLAAARAMREILIDHARRDGRLKRGGNWSRITLDDVPAVQASYERLDLQEALHELAKLNQRQGDVISLRFYCGMTVPEVAETLELSVSTVESDYRVARAWLYDRLQEPGP